MPRLEEQHESATRCPPVVAPPAAERRQPARSAVALVSSVYAEGDLDTLLAEVAAVKRADPQARDAAARRIGRWAWLYIPAVLRPVLAARAAALGQCVGEHLTEVVLPAAVLLVLGSGEAERPQRIWLGRRYLRDAAGRVALVRPAECVPARAVLYQHWLRGAIQRAALADLDDRPWPERAPAPAVALTAAVDRRIACATWNAKETAADQDDELSRLLAVASPVQRAMVEHFLVGADRAQTAAALGLNVSTLRVQLHRLRRKIA